MNKAAQSTEIRQQYENTLLFWTTDQAKKLQQPSMFSENSFFFKTKMGK